jgi:hypothetical protein
MGSYSIRHGMLKDRGGEYKFLFLYTSTFLLDRVLKKDAKQSVSLEFVLIIGIKRIDQKSQYIGSPFF